MCEFNGYTNYETWLFSLYYGDDEWLKEQIKDKYNECKNDILYLSELVDYLQSLVEYECFDGKEDLNGFLNDLLDNALLNVNYYEIVEKFIASFNGGEKEDA